MRIRPVLLFTLLSLTTASCVKQIDLSDHTDYNKAGYLYPFGQEASQMVAEITIRTNTPITQDIKTEIPPLKYNKSWLFMLTQDDCKQSAYCCTWAAIHGKPLSPGHYYDAAHLLYGDLPPDAYYLNKTLGSTDGAGNEVRFSFTTTLMPEAEWMNAPAVVAKKQTKDDFRFKMKSGLIWNNVREMLNYGVGIAFHDVQAADVTKPALILKHYGIVQDSIRKRLSGRGCKTLAEPNGNKNYVTAALSYSSIQTMTAQNGTEILYPFQVESQLSKTLINRVFNDNPSIFKGVINDELKRPKEERKAIYIGVHNTDIGWVNLLSWLNDTYGKDGDDSMWAPSQGEYYEYNYYRLHSTQKVIKVDENTWKISITLPSEEYFYYPSVTVNLQGINKEQVASIHTNEAISGLSYADFEEGMMINIDCHRFLVQHATEFVERYEKDKSNKSNRADALYFVGMLKESAAKTSLLNRIQ
ncbi:MAG: hypothetical protein RR471_03920 [Bacteroides sp.]